MAAEQKQSDAKTFTAEEVAKHNKESDCWIVVHGKVYDVTKYLEEHPGGPEIIMDVAGQDATAEFEDTGHSDDARETLKKHYIGEAPEMKSAAASGGASGAGAKQGEGPSLLMILAVLVALAAGMYMMYEPTQAIANEGEQ